MYKRKQQKEPFDVATLERTDSGMYTVSFRGDTFTTRLEQVRNIPGRIFNPVTKVWSIPESGYKQLVSLGFYDITPHTTDTVDTPVVELNKRLLQMLPYQLYPYQEEGVRFLLERQATRMKGGIIALDAGLGKTLTSMAWYGHTKCDRPLLIVCPASLKDHWKREIRKTLKITATKLPNKVSKFPKGEVHIINYDILKRNESILKGKYSCIIADEAHYLANESQRTTAFRSIAESAENVVFLTATPAEQPMKLWNMLEMLDPVTWCDKTKYIQRYCQPKATRYGIMYGAERLEELHDKIKPYLFKRNLEDVGMSLPEEVNCFVEVEVEDPEYMKESEALIELLEKENPDEIQEEILTRIHELSRSAFFLKRDEFYSTIDNLIENTGDSVVIFYHHAAVGKDIQNYYKCNRIGGDIDPDKRQAIIDSFEEDETQRVLVLQDVAGSTGFSILSTGRMAFAELPITYRDSTQARARVRRVNSTVSTCFYHYIIAVLPEGESIDERMLNIIRTRGATATTMIDGAQAEILK